MDRQQFIEFIGKNKKVIYQDKEYIPQAYILRLINDEWIHQVELKDLSANSVIITNLSSVREV
jgi:hypothetical protein